MGVRVKDDGQFKEIYVKALDSMPVGSIVEYNGTVGDIPDGWEQANDIIWTNSSPSSTISTSTISNIDMTNYDELEVGFRQYNSNDILTIARFKKVIGTTPVLSYSEVGNGFWVIRSRVLNLTSNTSIGITQGYQTVTGGTASASDNVCIPVYIKGYNTGLIRKTSETRPLASHTVNAYSESESNAYSCDYSNKAFGGVVLYENASGTTSNITLSDSASNYDYIDIYFQNNDAYCGFVRIYSPNNKVANLLSCASYGAESYFSNRNIKIVGTTINTLYSSGFYIANNTVNGSTNANNISITRVIGYKTGLFPTQQSTRSLNTYSGDIEEKKNIVIDNSEEEKPIDGENKK